MYYIIVPIMASLPPPFFSSVGVSSILLFKEVVVGEDSRAEEGGVYLEFDNRST